MAKLSFTANLLRHVETPSSAHEGATVGEVLESYFADHPQVRNYLLNDQGAVRKHVSIFINGRLIADRTRLTDPTTPHDDVFVAQALSGG